MNALADAVMAAAIPATFSRLLWAPGYTPQQGPEPGPRGEETLTLLELRVIGGTCLLRHALSTASLHEARRR